MEATVEREQIQADTVDRFISFGEWWERFGDEEEEEPAPDLQKAA